MKLAILGKGGTGKSSMSWLIAKYLSESKKVQTLAIDGDHNMDLASCLGVDTEAVKFFKDFNTDFRELAGMPQIGMWKQYFNHKPVDFSYPDNSKIQKYITKISPKLDLIVEGLGDEDLMLSNKCSHALSAPIKYMMPTLTLVDDSWVVFDSVAGSDMLNYGIYFGFDVLCCVVEGHTNSIKVAQQLKILTDKQGLMLNFILNKYNPENVLIKDFEQKYQEFIIGKVPSDLAIVDYDYLKIDPVTISNLGRIIDKIENMPKVESPYLKLKVFEEAKS